MIEPWTGVPDAARAAFGEVEVILPVSDPAQKFARLGTGGLMEADAEWYPAQARLTFQQPAKGETAIEPRPAGATGHDASAPAAGTDHSGRARRPDGSLERIADDPTPRLRQVIDPTNIAAGGRSDSGGLAQQLELRFFRSPNRTTGADASVRKASPRLRS